MISRLEAGHLVADLDDHSRGLVPDRERSGKAGRAVGDIEIEIAARHRQGPDDGVAVIL